MKIKFVLFTLCLVLLTFIACNKDEIVTTNTTTIVVNPPNNPVTADVLGKVQDEQGRAMADVAISVGNVELTTDENGLFYLTDVNINSYGTLVRATKSGYFDGAKMFQTNGENRAYTEITLMEKQLTQTLESDQGGLVSLTNGSQVLLQEGGFIKADGSAYIGEVNVYAKWLDPTTLATLEMMPGDLRAVNSENTFMQLATYGMIVVELEGEQGQSLNLAEGKPAELTFPLPTTLQDNAPSSIPLWYFDEATGYWIEEGEAALVNGSYVGSVAHFSFWNCDAPFPLIELGGHITDTDGNGLANVLVKIELQSGLSSGCGYTNDYGLFDGKVPANEQLIISVYGPCDNVIYTAPIGPFSENTFLDPIAVSPAVANVLFVGVLQDCDGNPLPNGYISLDFGDFSQYLFSDDIGHFSGVLNTCEATEVTITAYNVAGLTQSTPSLYTLNGDELNVGTLTACETLEEYFYYIIDGSLTSLTEMYAQYSPNDSMGIVPYYFLSGTSPDINGYPTIGIEVPTNLPGTYNPDYILLWDVNSNQENIVVCNPCSDLEITFTQISPVVGEMVEATFSGQADLNGTQVDISGAFRKALQ